jgi:release factor glutamine methyltransferase
MNYKELCGEIKAALKDDFRSYCQYLLDKNPKELLFDNADVSDEVLSKHTECLKRINAGEPIQYVFGYAPFYDLYIDCAPGVLIPRFDTEVLVEEAIKTLPQNAYFADLCCGTGCIAAAVLKHREDTKALCLDISDKALEMTGKNVKKYGLQSRCNIQRFDVFGDWSGLPRFDSILCNPPYINAKDMKTLPDNVKKEPYEALYGGEDGLDFYREIIKKSKDHFKGLPHIIFEIGYDEADGLRELTGFKCEIKKDLSNNDRLCIIRG